MFTGIVRARAAVREFPPGGVRRLTIVRPSCLDAGLEEGASVAVDGVCLTVAGFGDSSVWFDVVPETLRCTTLGRLASGDDVNVEPSLRAGDELGGHFVSGHVDAVGTVTGVDTAGSEWRLTVSVPEATGAYLFRKGFVAVDGASLTLAAVDVPPSGPAAFTVALVPETLSRTGLGGKTKGDGVNVEIDPVTRAVVETVRRSVAGRGRAED